MKKNNNEKEIQGVMEQNCNIIKHSIATGNFTERIKLSEFCYYYFDHRTNGGNKDNRNFSIIMNGKNGKTKLNAEIQLARFVEGRYIPDVIIIKNEKNERDSIVIGIIITRRDSISPDNIEESLYASITGEGYVKYLKDEKFNGKNKDEIILKLQKLCIKNVDGVNYDDYLKKQRKKGSLSR